MDRSGVNAGRSSAGTARGSNNSSGDRPRIVLYAENGVDTLDDDDDAHSELDVDMYDADVADSWDDQFSIGGETTGGSILSEPTSAAEAYNYSLQGMSGQHQQSLHHRRADEASPASDAWPQERSRVLTFETMSSQSSQNYRVGRVPMGHQPFIRTNFTTQDGVGTPGDPYDMLGTPPGDPPSTRPDEMPTLEAETKLPRMMQTRWLLAVVIVSFALGAAGHALELPEEVGYWLTVVGALYLRAVNCVTLPMAFCQVVVSVATLTTKSTLSRLWLKTLTIFCAICIASVTVGLIIAYAMRPLMKQQDDLGLKLTHATFAFKCANNKYFEQEPDGSLACRGDAVQPNTTFPWLVDTDGTLGLDEAVSTVDFSGYFFALFGTYFPNNLVASFVKDKFLSVLLVATVVGIAVARSFRGLESRSNPLLRLVMHIYASLFSILDWLQQAVFIATVPQILGSVLANPNASHIMSVARYYCLTAILLSLIHCVVIVPTVFYVFTKRNPFVWIRRVTTPLLYAVILQSAFLPLSVVTKTVMRTTEVPPAVFGALYPVLAALNRSSQAIGLPLGLVFVAGFSGCNVQLTVLEALKLFGVTFLACWGEAALGRSQLAYFLMVWRTVCTNEDTPSAVLAISSISVFIYRLSAFINTFTNLMIIRMVASTKQSKLHA